jgi:hypothetical protein
MQYDAFTPQPLPLCGMRPAITSFSVHALCQPLGAVRPKNRLKSLFQGPGKQQYVSGEQFAPTYLDVSTLDSHAPPFSFQEAHIRSASLPSREEQSQIVFNAARGL